MLVRNGQRKDLPILDNAELGYANDTGQVFIGADPSQNTNLYGRRIVLSPIPNVRNYVQSILNNSTLYNVYLVTSELYIDTESSSKALEIMNFINDKVATHYSNIKPIATISTNIELITAQNIGEYSNPSMDIVNYNPNDGFANPNRRVLSKILSLSNGDVFLEYARRDCSHIVVDYSLVQNNGEHKRSGVITIVGDNNADNPYNISFSDDQTKMLDGYSPTHIMFYGEYNNGRIQIKFTQPTTHETKIFFRVTHWGIDQLSDLTANHITPSNELVTIGVGENFILGFDTDVSFPNSGDPVNAGTGSGSGGIGALYGETSLLPSGTNGDYLYHNGTTWVPTKIKHPYSIGFACGDENTLITAPINTATKIYSVVTFKLQKIKFSLNTISNQMTVALKVNGVVIYTGDITSAVLTHQLQTPRTISEDDIITVDIINVGSGTSNGLKVYLHGEI